MTPDAMKILGTVLMAMLAVAIGIFLWLYVHFTQPLAVTQTPQVLNAIDVAVDIPVLDTLVVEVGDGANQLFSCSSAVCKKVYAPDQIQSEGALFDGTSWFYFNSEGSLTSVAANGEEATIIKPTNLVAPRDITISPTGGLVAYWLDNIDSVKNGQRTELWVYDSSTQGTRVVAENLVKDDIVSRVRWNKSGTALWFVADSGEGKAEELEFIVATPGQTGVRAQFLSEDVEALRDTFDHGIVDVSPSGSAITYGETTDSRFSTISVLRDGGTKQEIAIRGLVPYIEWLDEGSFLYAVQSGSGIEFWRWKEGVTTPVSRSSGVLDSALSDASGKYVVYTSRDGFSGTSVYVLDIQSGRVRLQSKLSSTGGAHVAWVRPAHQDTSANIEKVYDDAELIGFVEKHAESILGASADLKRITTTDSPNALYIDFESGGVLQRMLVIIRDAIYPEWTVQGLYENAGGLWRKKEGQDTADPASKNLYEWENPPGQWILKDSFSG